MSTPLDFKISRSLRGWAALNESFFLCQKNIWMIVILGYVLGFYGFLTFQSAKALKGTGGLRMKHFLQKKLKLLSSESKNRTHSKPLQDTKTNRKTLETPHKKKCSKLYQKTYKNLYKPQPLPSQNLLKKRPGTRHHGHPSPSAPRNARRSPGGQRPPPGWRLCLGRVWFFGKKWPNFRGFSFFMFFSGF